MKIQAKFIDNIYNIYFAKHIIISIIRKIRAR